MVDEATAAPSSRAKSKSISESPFIFPKFLGKLDFPSEFRDLALTAVRVDQFDPRGMLDGPGAHMGRSAAPSGCARISIMAKSTKALLTGRIQKCKTNPSIAHIGLATHGRSIQKVLEHYAGIIKSRFQKS
jgi:hypothetical protein